MAILYMEVNSKESLIQLYRNYVEQLGILDISFSNGKTIKRDQLEEIVKMLYVNKYVSVELIDSKLSSIKDHKWLSLELYDILKLLKLIGNDGRSLNPCLTPEYMANCIVNHIVFIDVKISSNEKKRIKIELFNDKVPKTANNFLMILVKGL